MPTLPWQPKPHVHRVTRPRPASAQPIHQKKSMTVYFYHTQDIQYILGRMKEGKFPSHYLYGAAHLPDEGISVVWHKSSRGLPRWRETLRTAWHVLRASRSIDAVYATHYKGLELIVLLRALGLFRKPIIVWHHQPVITPRSRLREWGGRLFYRGLDRMIFFSQKLVDDSLHSPKARRERMVVGHWGADLDFYDRIRTCRSRRGFISTGKEQRDQATLVNAFNAAGCRLTVYVGINKDPSVPNPNLEAFEKLRPADNVEVKKIMGLLPYELAVEVDKAACVCVCCKPTRYTAGLTTVVEALALGLPVICSRNPQIPVDFDADGCGVSVAYHDVEGWARAAAYIESNPDIAIEMGRRGRELAESKFNDRQCAREVAAVIKSCLKTKE